MRPEILLRLEHVKHYFPLGRNVVAKAVDDVSFSIHKGEIFGLIGESGCGKSTLARGVAGMSQPTSGNIYFNDYLISDKSVYAKHKADIQRNIQIIFQDSSSALNPYMTIGNIVAEPLIINHCCQKREEISHRVVQLLQQVGLDEYYVNKYPYDMSGGQRQRVNIARSLALAPQLIVADEPIASLDVSMQAQIISLFQSLRDHKGLSFLLIAHDLSMVRYISDRVGVMYKGKLVEIAPTEALFSEPQHPYTQALLSSVPIPDPQHARQKARIVFFMEKQALSKAKRYDEYKEDHWVLRVE